MASALDNPKMAHSLWLQRRSSHRRVRPARWRSDWTPVGLFLLLVGLLLLVSLFLPSDEEVGRVKQAAQHERGGSQPLPMVGVLSEP